jgi:hypothetical protein
MTSRPQFLLQFVCNAYPLMAIQASVSISFLSQKSNYEKVCLFLMIFSLSFSFRIQTNGRFVSFSDFWCKNFPFFSIFSSNFSVILSSFHSLLKNEALLYEKKFFVVFTSVFLCPSLTKTLCLETYSSPTAQLPTSVTVF